MGKLNRVSLPDQLYEDLKRRIISLELPLGSRLNASELQKYYAVSSTPVREALNRLSRDGLIAYTNNIGAHVIFLTKRDVIEISEVGFALRAEALRLAMRHGLAEKMADAMQRYLELYQQENDAEKLRQYILKIVRLFFDTAGNSRLVDTIIRLAPQLDLLHNLFIKALQEQQIDFAEKIQDHKRLCQCIREENMEAAVRELEALCYHGAELAQQGLDLLLAENKH